MTRQADSGALTCTQWFVPVPLDSRKRFIELCVDTISTPCDTPLVPRRNNVPASPAQLSKEYKLMNTAPTKQVCKHYAVLVSDENGNRPNIDAEGVSIEEAQRICKIADRPEVRIPGATPKVSSSWLASNGRVWSIVRGKSCNC
jgi:hypothetical protein